EIVEGGLQGVARLRQRLLKELVLPAVRLAQGNHFLAEPINGRGAERRVAARGRRWSGLLLFFRRRVGRQHVAIHGDDPGERWRRALTTRDLTALAQMSATAA